MKKTILAFLLFLSFGKLYAQPKFFSTVRIEYEKTTSVHAQYKDLDPEWFDRIKDRLPVSVITYHEFIGDTEKSIFRPGKETVIDNRSWYRPVADKNVVFTDYNKGITISQKPVYEETFLVEDTLLKIKWKITPDTRVIAGFECRKAVGILYDSIAIFAFYTDELMITGGPEGVQGLPGMILGMGIPRLHSTWFATKVEVFNINTKAIQPATKGKKVSRQSMIQSLDRVLKQWGTYGSKLIVNYLI
jgi:GLPGLI family protein